MKTALIIGLGKSGKGAAELLLNKGYKVYGVDRQPTHLEGVTFFPEGTEVPKTDLVVISPGIPLSHPLARGNVIGEAELAFRYLNNRAIGITGTNGKTTFTLLVTHLLNIMGKRARALGNIGNSLAKYATCPDPEEILVVEVSSFQLETFFTPVFDAGIILNITPDHLDRHPSFEAYREAKYGLKGLVKDGGTFIGEESSLQLTVKKRYWEKIGPLMAQQVLSLLKPWGVNEKVLEEALKTFEGPPHRLERVAEVMGLNFVNDSKGTNVAAVLFGIEQISSPVLLIAGGYAKGQSFKGWREPFKNKVKAIFAIGAAAKQIEAEVGDVIPTYDCKTIDCALQEACAQGKKGETILLSPGCASFDQFQNYAERGERYKELIQRLRKKQ